MHRSYFGYLKKPSNTSVQDPATPIIFFQELILHFWNFNFLSLVEIGEMAQEVHQFIFAESISIKHSLEFLWRFTSKTG